MFKAEIVADSLSPQGERLISVLATFPRIILAEVNTHKMLSKNTSSSRAIPYFKVVDSVINNTFIPIAWQTHHKGMQGSEYISADTIISADIFFYDFIKLIEEQAKEDKVKLSEEFYRVLESLKDTFHSMFGKGSFTIKEFWLKTRDLCVLSATILYTLGKVSKQLCNRLLEPFMWTTMLITGNAEDGSWNNFFNLRCPQYTIVSNFVRNNETEPAWTDIYKSKKDLIDKLNPVSFNGVSIKDMNTVDWLKLNKGQAEIHMMHLAELIYDAVQESTPKQLKAGEWHIPFYEQLLDVQFNNGKPMHISNEDFQLLKVKASTAMSAHTSYTVVGEEKVLNGKDLISLHDRLITQNPPHSSPMEHCAQCMDVDEYRSFVKGDCREFDYKYDNVDDGSKSDIKGWCRNFKGFIPYRHIVEQEYKS